MQLRHTFGVRSITWLGLETTSGMEYPRFRKTLKDTTSRQNGRAEARFWIWKRALPDWTATSVREVVGAVYDRAQFVEGGYRQTLVTRKRAVYDLSCPR